MVWLETLNAFIFPLSLRRYQRDIWQTGSFTIEPPGFAQLTCDFTVFHGSKTYAWRFGDHLWLTSDGVSSSFKIVCLYDLTSDILYVAPRASHAHAQFLLSERHRAVSGTAPPILIAGHQNFAHFIWNELPALMQLETIPGAVTRIDTTYEPVLPLSTLIRLPPSLRMTQLKQGSLRYPLHEYPGVLFSAGAVHVTQAVKDRVLGLCTAYAGLAADTPKKSAKRIWLSLRTIHRSARNELEVFSCLVDLLGLFATDIEILLDGYSLGHDIVVDDRYDAAAQRANNDAAAAVAASLQARPAPPNVRFIDLTRAALPTAIAWAATADVYICHHGTQQHKIGWLTDVPGIVHTNPHVLATYPADWVTAQAEGASRPAYIPLDLVEEIAGEAAGYSQDYRFADPQQAALYLVGYLTSVMFPPPR
jgi:hypothetical protein